MSEQTLTLYAEDFRVPPVLHVVQNDTGRTVQILIADYEVPAGAGAWLWMKIPGTETKVILAGTVSGQNVTVELTGAALAVDGKTPAMVQLTSGGKYVKTFGFYIDIQAQVGGEQVTPEEEELFEDLMAGVDQKFTGYEDEIDGTMEAFRAEFDEFIGAQGEHNETVLWTGTAYLVDAAITLDYVPDDYQEIKIYASGEWHYYKTSAFIDHVNGVTIKKSTLHSNGTPANFHHAELSIKASYDHSDANTTDEQKKAFTIYRHRVLAWSGDDAADASQTSVDQDFDTSQSDQVTLVEIRGVSNNANAEVADARVGYDGTTYASLGAAIRSQVQEVMQSGGLSEDAKQALLACLRNLAWATPNGQNYYDAFYDALYPPVILESIEAVFTQGQAVIYNTDSLDSLKQYLVVTGSYSDSTTATIADTDYTLLGELVTGTSTITVSYAGKTDTFDVTVTTYVPHFNVTNTLTHATTSNNATTVEENATYTAVLTADSGYEITTTGVTVTMSNVDITSTAFDFNTKTITVVATGDIVITCVAEVQVLPTWTSGTAYTISGDNVIEGKKLITSTGAEETDANSNATNYLNCVGAYAVTIYPITLRVYFYDKNHNFISSYYNNVTYSSARVPVGAAYVRASGSATIIATDGSGTCKLIPMRVPDEEYTPGVQNITWEDGAISTTTGNNTSGTGKKRTAGYIPLYKATSMTSDMGQPSTVTAYDADKHFVKSIGTNLNSITSAAFFNYAYIRISGYSSVAEKYISLAPIPEE